MTEEQLGEADIQYVLWDGYAFVGHVGKERL